MYFRMMPLSLSGGSHETNTTELLEAAALTPAGGPGTAEEESSVRVQKSQDTEHEYEGIQCLILLP